MYTRWYIKKIDIYIIYKCISHYNNEEINLCGLPSKRGNSTLINENKKYGFAFYNDKEWKCYIGVFFILFKTYNKIVDNINYINSDTYNIISFELNANDEPTTILDQYSCDLLNTLPWKCI